MLTTFLCVWMVQSAGATAVGAKARPPAQVSETSASADALIRGDAQLALVLADKALQARRDDAWAHYNKAAALAALDRVDEAVAEYEQAAGRFGDEDRRGRAVALWGRGRALDRAGRCDDAARAFREYVDFVKPTDPASAATAEARIQACKPAVGTAAPTGEAPAPWPAPSP